MLFGSLLFLVGCGADGPSSGIQASDWKTQFPITFVDGSLQYTIHDVQTAPQVGKLYSDGSGIDHAKGVYYIVHVTEKNILANGWVETNPALYHVIADGKDIQMDEDATDAREQQDTDGGGYMGTSTTLQYPNQTAEADIVFDVPKNAKHVSLKFYEAIPYGTSDNIYAHGSKYKLIPLK